ncbi:MAG: TrkH family potassium uptake protein [Caldilineaceae bacterium]|nr:TrkH family potassium uptake protein [Caldilineaceae bacterium]
MTQAANRYRDYLRARYRCILGYTGLITAIVGLLMLTPLALLFFYPQERAVAPAFLVPGLALLAGGLILWRRLIPRTGATLSYQEGAVIVVLAWLVALLAGTVPFIWLLKYSFSRAFFESTSGWTTTGLSTVDVLATSHVMLFYRSVIQWAGGAGLAIIALSALAGPTGPGMSVAEGRGEQLAPHVRRSATLVLGLYTAYNVIGTVLLRLVGMNWFDSVNHAFAALSTGGFSTRPESIGYWDSATVEAAIILLMLLGTLNFLTAYTLLHGKWRAVIRNGEIHVMAFLIPLCAGALFFLVTLNLYPTLGKSARVAIFETVTAISTTGFNTIDYRAWPSFGWIVLIVLMLIGGGAGSTAGAIKQYRVYVLYKALVWEIKRMFLPPGAVTEPDAWVGETRQFLNDARIRQVALFVFIYLAAFFVGSAMIAAHGFTVEESLFEFASSIGTIGISVGVTSADLPQAVLWSQIVGMIMGRLEFFTVIVGVGKLISDARQMV